MPQQTQIDYAIKGNQNYLSMICALTGFIKVVKTAYQSKNEAMRCVREWAALYRMPYAIKADSGPLFRLSFKKELEELGVKTIHSSIYHSQSPVYMSWTQSRTCRLFNKGAKRYP